MKTKKSFQYKLLIFFSISIIASTVLLAVTISIFFKNKILKERSEYSASILYSISKNLSTYANDLKRLALAPYTFGELMNFYNTVENGNYANLGTYKVYNQRYQYIQATQRLLGTSREDILAITFVPNNPNEQLLLTTTKSQELKENRDLLYREQRWFQDVLNNNGDVIYSISDPIPQVKGHEKVFLAIHKVRNVYTKKDIGVIRIDASTHLIDDILSNVKLSGHSAFLLVDENNNIVYKTGKVDLGEMAAEELNADQYRLGKNIWDIYKEPIEEMDWELVYFSSRNDARRETAIIWVIVTLLSMIAIFIAFFLFAQNVKETSGSLRNILGAMERVANGNLGVPIPMDGIQKGYFSNKEFVLIANHINQMMNQLSQHIEKEYIYEIHRQKAEYRVLQSQINPHFLYNTLNGFVTLNRIGRKQELEESIIHLTKMFRYTCNNSETTNVKEEFDFCYQYIMLQKMRYDDRIHYVESLSPETEDIVIPRLILQPLVENVIKHGIDGWDDTVTIWIESKLKDNILYLSVKNNGIPIDLDHKHLTDCVGLGNIENRLYIFNNEAEMTVGLERGTVTYMVLKIPINKEVME